MLKKIFHDNHSISLLTTGINILFAGLGFWLLINTYPKEDIGKWVIYSTGLQLVEMFRAGLLFTALIKFLSIHNDDSLKRREIIGSAWVLGLASSLVILLFLYSIFFMAKETLIQKGFSLFFELFSLSFMLLMPLSIGVPILISRQEFKKIFFIRLGSTLPVTIFLALNCFMLKLDLTKAILISIILSLPMAIYCIINGVSGIQYIFKFSNQIIMKLLNFGKYSMLTLLGANLLRSSDVYIIGLFLSSVDVANYGIPFKIIILFESFLNSFCDVAMPRISREAGFNDNSAIRKLFYKYAGFITAIMIPCIVLFSLASKSLLWLIGGSKFLDNPAIYYVLLIFIISFLFHPVDRFTGVTLDSINQPVKNLLKVIIMVTINIIGDLIVINIYKSIIPVALITILNVIAGSIIGLLFLKKEIGINRVEFFSYFFEELKQLFKRRAKANS